MTFELVSQNGFEARGPSSRGSQLRFAPLTSVTTLDVMQERCLEPTGGSETILNVKVIEEVGLLKHEEQKGKHTI